MALERPIQWTDDIICNCKPFASSCLLNVSGMHPRMRNNLWQFSAQKDLRMIVFPWFLSFCFIVKMRELTAKATLNGAMMGRLTKNKSNKCRASIFIQWRKEPGFPSLNPINWQNVCQLLLPNNTIIATLWLKTDHPIPQLKDLKCFILSILNLHHIMILKGHVIIEILRCLQMFSELLTLLHWLVFNHIFIY